MRTQLSKLALSASIMLAMVFTFSCSSGDDGNNNSGGGGNSIVTCKISNADGVAGNVVCEEMEVPADKVEKVKAECINNVGGEVLSGCPSGYTETCERAKNKVDKQTLYVYFNIPNGKVCKDYFL
jgi:hypothetical protein